MLISSRSVTHFHSFRNQIRVSNSLNTDQVRRPVGPGPAWSKQIENYVNYEINLYKSYMYFKISNVMKHFHDAYIDELFQVKVKLPNSE